MTNLIAGQKLGKYQIVSSIGRGGMASVYKGFDSGLKRPVAIKVLLAHLAADTQILQRFEREATTAANLKHPNIVVIHDVGSADEIHYIVMELLEGRTLREDLSQVERLPLSRVVPIVYQLSSALDYAHQHDLVHRDLKPSNVMLGAGDHVTLMDFGLVKALRDAQLTDVGCSIGTLDYMSPEQLEGEDVDVRSDVYSLGIVAYEMLAGRRPFQGDTPFQIIQDVLCAPPPALVQFNPDVLPGVQSVIERALAKQSDDRYGSAGQFAEALYCACAGDELGLLDDHGREYRLHKGRVTIGRGPDNMVVVNDHQVSRLHAEIRFENSVWLLADLDSTNGTFVNHVRVVVGKPVRLSPDDVIRLGPTTSYKVVSRRVGKKLGRDETLYATNPTTRLPEIKS